MNEKAQTGRFITLEGIEGVGKSTIIPMLCARLEQAGVRVRSTREPGGSPMADRIRGLLLEQGGVAPSPEAELLLMFAARAEHLADTVLPSLEEGIWILSDRFTDASYAYQGAGRGIPDERIGVLEEWVQGSRRPDRTLLLDAPVEIALERARRRSPADRFESETSAFFERARAKYLERARAEPGRFRVIDATADPVAVAEFAWRALTDLLPGARA